MQVGLMVSMGVYGAMWAVLSATGPRIAQDRSVGWLRQLRLLPVRPNAVPHGAAARGAAAGGPALVLVLLTAVLTHGVTLDAGRWLALLALLWLGVVPVAVLGSPSATRRMPTRRSACSTGCIWCSRRWVDSGCRSRSACRAADLWQAAAILPRGGWRWHIAFGKALDYSSVLYLLAWTAVFAVIALYFSRRAVAAR